VRDIIGTALPWIALLFVLLGMRDWDPAIPISLLILIFLFWAINWLVHHISLRWLRYLRIVFWVAVFGAGIAVPELRALFEDVVKGLLTLQSSTLIILSIITLIAWAAQQPNSPSG
jgi:hypothetical protein